MTHRLAARFLAWLNTRPTGVPFVWTAMVFAVIVLVSAAPESVGSMDLNTGSVPWLDL